MSTARIAATRGYVIPALLPKGPRGFSLCRWCQRECPRRAMTFCGPACIREHRLRTDPVYVRECVLLRDRGVCAVCRVDTVAVQADLRALPARERNALAARLGYPLTRGELWDADHVRPVAEGGGECGLDGYQTLCVTCHRAKSAAQAVRRTR